MIDEIPPVIVPIGFTDGSDLSKATRMAFTVTDNFTRFKNVRAELDGNWLRFTNDKGRTFIYRFDEKCLTGQHELRSAPKTRQEIQLLKLSDLRDNP